MVRATTATATQTINVTTTHHKQNIPILSVIFPFLGLRCFRSTKGGDDNVQLGSNDDLSPHLLWRLHGLTPHGSSLTSSQPRGGSLASLFDGTQLCRRRTHGKPAVGSMG